jgi:hypothetical protein
LASSWLVKPKTDRWARRRRVGARDACGARAAAAPTATDPRSRESGHRHDRIGRHGDTIVTMSIDKSGTWWVGSAPEDLDEYLHAYSEDGHAISAFRLARCVCGSLEFTVEFDGDEGAARRTCTACHASHFMCESGEVWDDAEPEGWECTECATRRANVGGGFATRGADVRWVFVGVRCVGCGVLGCVAEWKVSHAPSANLIDLV